MCLTLALSILDLDQKIFFQLASVTGFCCLYKCTLPEKYYQISADSFFSCIINFRLYCPVLLA